jgi:exopolysaccharide production protein ExoQ
MTPFVALFAWFTFVVGLLAFDSVRGHRLSPALWVPVISIFIFATRSLSQWLSGGVGGLAAEVLEEGNPLDRTISLVLMLLAISILMSRSFNFGGFFANNLALMAFLSFALVSVCWSDFPFVAFKRWFRDLGSYLMVLVVVSGPHPLEAVRAVLRRLGYLLLPLSILLVKYYPELGKVYDPWTGIATYAGATTSKNQLGVACLVTGVFFFWDTLTHWRDRKERRVRWTIGMNLAFVAMTFWLLNLAQSTTSEVCLGLGCLVVAAAYTPWIKRHPSLFKVGIPLSFCLYLVLYFGLDMGGRLAGAVGKDPTLTDRTKIWAFVLGMHTNPLIGTGYQSFWLGSRLQLFWQNSGLGRLNEAHNGYLEIYLNLGLIGVFLVIGFLVVSYRTMCRRLASSYSLAVLGMAVWLALVFYNMTEAAFGGGLLWMMLLMSAVVPPGRAKSRAYSSATFDAGNATGRHSNLALEMTGERR